METMSDTVWRFVRQAALIAVVTGVGLLADWCYLWWRYGYGDGWVER